MPITSATRRLISIWILSFVVLLLIALTSFPGSKEDYFNLVKCVLGIYSPHIAIILGFVFSKKRAASSVKSVGDQADNRIIRDLAFLFVVAYNLLFLTPLLMFRLEYMVADKAIDMIEDLKPLTTFLVAGVMTYYFSSTPGDSAR